MKEDDIIELSLSELVGLEDNDLSNNNDTTTSTKPTKTYGLSLAYHRLTVLPYHIATDSLTSSITSLDLTDCKIQYLESLQNFTRLNVLILDHNNIEDISNCPSLHTLETLWCNNNRINKLGTFLNNCADKFPSLKHLSIMRNPGVPDIPLLMEEYQANSRSNSTTDNDNNNNNGHKATDLIDDKADQKSERALNENIDYKLDNDIKNENYTNDTKLNDNDITNGIKNDSSQQEYQLYRPAVYSVLKNLESLDGIYFTSDEINQSTSEEVGSWIATDDLDETENWKWPAGYTPSLELLRDKKKMKMIKHVQNILDLRPISREKAKLTYWNLDKRTVLRYLEASLWKEELNGTPVYQAILDTINWRQYYGFPFSENDRVWLKEGLGKGFIIIPCTYDSYVYSKIESTICKNDGDTDISTIVNDSVLHIDVGDNDDDDGEIGLEMDCFLDTDSNLPHGTPSINPNSRYRTKDGKPVIFIQFANDQCTNGNIKGKTLLYSFERAIQLLPRNQTSFLVIIDMKGFGYNSAPAMKDLKEIGESLSKHMCCRLFKVYIVNVSFITKMVYDTISSLFSEVTRAKFVFISDKNEITKNLRDLIDIDNIPTEYGGNATNILKFDFDQYIDADPFVCPSHDRYKFCYS